MSLRIFHLGFISMAILFCLGASYRSFQLAEMQSTMPFQTMGGVSLLMALLLLGYSAWCLRNRNTNFLPGLILFAVVASPKVHACGTCYGDGSSNLAQGATSGGLVLLGMGVAMIVIYASFGYLWSLRAMRGD